MLCAPKKETFQKPGPVAVGGQTRNRAPDRPTDLSNQHFDIQTCWKIKRAITKLWTRRAYIHAHI